MHRQLDERNAPGHHTEGASKHYDSRPSLPRPADLLSDLDALAEHLRGRIVVQVEIDDDKFRTHIYRSTAAAEACVHRARERGKRSHVTLVQMLPVGVVTGLGGGRR